MLIFKTVQEEELFLMAITNMVKERRRIELTDELCPICGNTEYYFYWETQCYHCKNCKIKLFKRQTNGKWYTK